MAGVPGAATVAAATVMSAAGLPLEFVAVTIPIGVIADMARTATNVTAAAVSATVVARQTGLLDDEIFAGRAEFPTRTRSYPRPRRCPARPRDAGPAHTARRRPAGVRGAGARGVRAPAVGLARTFPPARSRRAGRRAEPSARRGNSAAAPTSSRRAELLLRDLGGFDYELQRTAHGVEHEAHRRLRETKLRAWRGRRRTDVLEVRLDDVRRQVMVREPGVGGECPHCSELYASAAHYCCTAATR